MNIICVSMDRRPSSSCVRVGRRAMNIIRVTMNTRPSSSCVLGLGKGLYHPAIEKYYVDQLIKVLFEAGESVLGPIYPLQQCSGVNMN